MRISLIISMILIAGLCLAAVGGVSGTSVETTNETYNVTFGENNVTEQTTTNTEIDSVFEGYDERVNRPDGAVSAITINVTELSATNVYLEILNDDGDSTNELKVDSTGEYTFNPISLPENKDGKTNITIDPSSGTDFQSVKVEDVSITTDSDVFTGKTYEFKSVTAVESEFAGNANGTVTWQEYDPNTDSWTNITTISVDGAGAYQDSITSGGQVRAKYEMTNGSLVDETVSFETAAPEIKNPSPTNGTETSETSVDLTIDISDRDFAHVEGDSVNVTIKDADSNTTLTEDMVGQNATLAAGYTDIQGGENNWSVKAKDSYGNTAGPINYTFEAPNELEIRDEENPNELVTDAEVTIEFYPQGDRSDVITRSATDGTVDMTGLDVDTNFIAVAKADGYVDRRIFIESLVETQKIYLLNESSDSVAVEFEIEDFSGVYDQESSVLVIEREISGEYTPIQGDFFGATGKWEAELKRDTRHRLKIRNIKTGDERTLGSFTPESSSTQTVTIAPDGAIQLTPEIEQILAQPAMGVIPAEENAVFGVEFREGDRDIENYEIEVTHMDPNGTSTTLATRSGSGTGVEEFELDLRGLEGSIVANVDVTTENGTKSVTVSREIRESYPGAVGLLGGLLSIGDGLGAGGEGGASGASSMVAFLFSVLVTGAVAGKTGASPDVTGLAALGSIAAFAIIGWVSMELLFAVAAAFAAIMILRRGI